MKAISNNGKINNHKDMDENKISVILAEGLFKKQKVKRIKQFKISINKV